MSDDLVPKSVESEQAVLGAILVNPDALFDVLPIIRQDDFWVQRHAWIWQAIMALHARREPVDYLTMVTELEHAGHLAEVGGAAYVLGLMNKTPSALNIEGYAREVERIAARRRMIEAAGRVANIVHSDNMDIEEVFSAADHEISSVIDRHVQTIAPDRSAEDVVVDLQIEACAWRDDPRDVRGLATGLYPLDMATGGFEPGLLYEVAARPGIGKSALIARVIRGLVFDGVSVALMSLEMTDKAMVRRMAVQMSMVDASLLRDGRLQHTDFNRYMEALDKLGHIKDMIFIVQRAGLSVLDMQAKVRQYERDHNVGMVIIDTLNRVHSDGKSPYERMTLVSHAVADWAHNSTYSILAAVQLSRANQKLSNKRPSLDAMRDSGAVEEDADWIGGLHREYAQANSEEERRAVIADGKEHLAELMILKNRDGESEKASELYWDAKSVNFERIERRRVELDPDRPMTYAAATVRDEASR